MNALKIKTFNGSAINPYITDLAKLRIGIFRDFPYLYDGSMAYEERYLSTYSQSPESLFVIVFEHERVVGMSTGLPMADESEAFKNPFRQNGYEPDRIFYFGESVLMKQYRGQGLGVRFFQEREQHANSLGPFTHTAFCAVERPNNHPFKPKGYKPLDGFWEKRGYQKHPELITHYPWTDIGDSEETEKPMIFWLKNLEGN